MNDDEYLDPATGVLTSNNAKSIETTTNVEQTNPSMPDDIFNKIELYNTYDIDDVGINGHYETTFNDNNGLESAPHFSTERLNFSNKYHQLNSGAASSIESSSLNSSQNTAIVNMTSF